MELDMSKEVETVQRDAFPAGNRKLQIVSAKESTSKKGNAMIEWTVDDIDAGLSDVIYTVSEQGKRWALKNLLDACGVKVKDGGIYIFNLDELEGKVIIATNKPFEQDFINRKGETQSEMKNKFTNFAKYVKGESDEIGF
jgi:hypothetical protein